jgi:hypothetical protein
MSSGGDPEPDMDPQDPLILGLPDPDPFVRGKDPDPFLERTEIMLENKILAKNKIFLRLKIMCLLASYKINNNKFFFCILKSRKKESDPESDPDS